MKSKIILVLAVIAISIGLYGMSQTSTTESPITNKVQELDKLPEPTVMVWIAKKDLILGSTVQRIDLEIQRISQTQADRFGIASDISFNFNKKLLLKKDIVQGDIVTSDMVLRPGQEGYLNLVIKEGKVPFNLEVSNDAILGGAISVGDIVDIASISSSEQNLSDSDSISNVKSLKMAPLLTQIMVLDIIQQEKSVRLNSKSTKTVTTLVLEVSNRELAKLVIAQRIAELEVHKSIGVEFSHELHADSSDVITISGSKKVKPINSIQEFRG
ncbi:Flp pilus assembly protein CpaB [Aliivibrio finisterrensis]|uniref:Flp pilus assembly protein CpaB n=1 Tax=Aliivibrio finisterrensis TaxID=511998 RepID=A0A4Q5KKE5_9GAMM|nr:Flp pilus assembly protein CpaB [Aliivibrio finisterrensis]RYU46707.1 Flp pilus assembly protein CpaB [Aliivibrio finisterrensis]